MPLPIAYFFLLRAATFPQWEEAGRSRLRRPLPQAAGEGAVEWAFADKPSGRDLSGSFPINHRELIKGGLQGLRQKSQRVALR
jgi:hypothetical protein